LKGSSIGFNSSISDFNDKTVGDSLKGLENQDLLKFGMIPEFIGRLPVIATLEELDQDMLIKIIQEPKNALLKQYNSLFKMDGIKLDIKAEALREIAQLAIKQKTGARGLRSIIENLLIDLMFEAPDKKDLEKIVINKDVVTKKSDPLMIYSNKQTNQKIIANKS
jgi:ATP-dependent Clp protease ATP-binding subunit ClpX